MRRAVFAIVVAALPLACGEDDDAPSPTPPRAGAVRTCDTHIEGRLPRFVRARDAAFGPVRMRGFRSVSAAALAHPEQYFRSREGEYGPHKFVTEVKAGADVVVGVAPRDQARARLLYANRRDLFGRFGVPLANGERAVRFRACPADEPAFAAESYGSRTVGAWTQFNGGMLFTEPLCLHLRVYEGDRMTDYVEPFGRPESDCD